MTMHITRIAPSPTGMFHLGSARTALFNWLIARASGGKFMLRIDDTDVARNTPEAVQVIFDAMEWLGLDYDIFARQSERIDRYRDLVENLMAQGLARLDEGAIRLVADARIIPSTWEDTITGISTVHDKEKSIIDGMVLFKSDGNPTYHFASVVDDMDFGVSWVVRGADHISNTPKQIAIWNALSHCIRANFNMSG